MTLDQKLLDERKAAIDYINSAPTPAIRQPRKQEMYHIIYGNPQKFSDWLKDKQK